MNFDGMIKRVSPGWALSRAQNKNRVAKAEAETELINKRMELFDSFFGKDVSNSGYSNGGAARNKTWSREWNSESLSPKSDIEENRKVLRERSRDLAMNAPLGTAAVASTRTNCVGSGLSPKPRIDYEFLGMSEEAAKELQKQIKKEFDIWASSTLCDNNDQNNFYELQQIAFMDWLRNGEEFALIKYDSEKSYMPYQLRIKLIEADRISSPGSLDGDYFGDKKTAKNGNSIINGVEIDSSGKVEAYYVASNFPGETGGGQTRWARIKKRGDKTGNPNILHIFNAERAEQYRGVPFLAPVIETLKQLTRYTEAEIMAAVINAMFSIFIQTETGEELGGFRGEADDEEDREDEDEDDKILLGSGTVNFLKVGEKVVPVESTHPSGGFDAFSNAMASMIGAALEIAPEVLLKKFTNNFSASKGAMNETWKSFKMRRTWFVEDFCQEIYSLWFAEAVSKGRIKAPGFFNDITIRKAYTNAKWNGPAQGQLDPVKEVNAAVSRMKNGLSTHEDECIAMNGSDYEDNVRALKNENTLLREAGEGMNPEQEKEEEESDHV